MYSISLQANSISAMTSSASVCAPKDSPKSRATLEAKLGVHRDNNGLLKSRLQYDYNMFEEN